MLPGMFFSYHLAFHSRTRYNKETLIVGSDAITSEFFVKYDCKKQRLPVWESRFLQEVDLRGQP